MQTQNRKRKFEWYLPTISGDIRLTQEGTETTTLHAFELTSQETLAMQGLRDRALSTSWGRKPWCSEEDFLPVTHATYRTHGGITLILQAPILDVQEQLAKALKPKRKLLSAVRFQDGRIEEAFERSMPLVEPSRNSEPSLPEFWADLHPDRAATVAAPTIGCPLPAFAEAEIRSSYVLEQFLTPDQIEDYRRYGHFVSFGRDTGHRYMVIHRERPQMISKFGGRQLYDLETNYPMCVHDWDVPPAEEMLALHLCLSIPGREHYVRNLAFAHG